MSSYYDAYTSRDVGNRKFLRRQPKKELMKSKRTIKGRFPVAEKIKMTAI